MNTTIHMGADKWLVTVPSSEGPMEFDLLTMTKDERRAFHAAFMQAFRAVRKKGKGKQ